MTAAPSIRMGMGMTGAMPTRDERAGLACVQAQAHLKAHASPVPLCCVDIDSGDSAADAQRHIVSLSRFMGHSFLHSFIHSRARLLLLDLPLIRPSPMSCIALLGLPGQLALGYVIACHPKPPPPPRPYSTLPALGPDRPAKPVGATASTGDPPGAVSRPEAGGRARPRGFCSRPRGASCCRICPPTCRVWRADACMPTRLRRRPVFGGAISRVRGGLFASLFWEGGAGCCELPEMGGLVMGPMDCDGMAVMCG